ncbi:hypothetical protein CVT25_010652 [Psilocybe cyanescens]|uniref:NADP-dependent oxidoreductase domain-containing protein n=1 Tax=Psilocybe cyanescens TaxID=93625 RepID=A0A409WJW8_PSICY|nr:hypothetical protein CVT25_010652 [Psilocybe cyanescens]
MSYGSPQWQTWVLPEEDSIKHIKMAYDAGINTFDTSNVYSNGQSEIVLGKAIKDLKLPRDEIVVMTKVFYTVARKMDSVMLPNPDQIGYVNQHGLSRKHIFESVKHSLKRLQLDYVDVLQCHRFDPDTPISETMQALHDVIKAGYVRYIGMSSCWAWQCVERSTGNLINGYSNDTGTKEIVDTVERIAKARDISMAQVALAWVISKEGVTAPIIGSTSLDNLKDLIGAVDVKLTDQELKDLEAPYLVQRVFGHS